MSHRKRANSLDMLFQKVVLIAMLFMTLSGADAPAKAADAAFDPLRHRWVTSLVGAANLDVSDPVVKAHVDKQERHAIALWTSMLKDPTTALWPNCDTAEQSSALTATVRNLAALAAAYATPGSTLYHNPALLQDITRGLTWFLTTRYTVHSPQVDNWWDWQIGVPIHLNSLLACLYDDLPPALLHKAAKVSAHFTPTIWATGANGVWRADIVLKRSILTHNKAGMQMAQEWMSTTMVQYFDPPADPVKSGFAEGYYRDGSFFAHDRHPYNAGYGLSAFTSTAQLMALVAGSPWAVSGPLQNNPYHWFRDSYEPFYYKGYCFDNTCGREISRGGHSKAPRGVRIVGALLPLTETAPEPDRAHLRAYVKGIASPAMLDWVGIGQIGALKAILDDPETPAADPMVLFKHFPFMARTNVLRRRFGASVAMYSDSVANYEFLNGENLKGWHTSDGWLQLVNDDAAQFTDGYWPTVDWHRLPGTTVAQNSTKPANSLNGSSWAGGVSLDGVSGVTGFELKPGMSKQYDPQTKITHFVSDGQTLSARKSWFMLEDKIVCLGSGITAADGPPIETIIENRRLSDAGRNALTVDGQAQLTAMGDQNALTPSWIHLEGSVPDSDLGYVFLTKTTVQTLRQQRSGKWTDLSHNKSEQNADALISRFYMTLWIDHGIAPRDASYAYTLLPGKSAQEVADYAKNPDIYLLANSHSVHAVYDETSQLIAANFWDDVLTEVRYRGKAWLSSDHKACVLVKRAQGQITLAISDPTRANTKSITVTLDLPVSKVLRKSNALRVDRLSHKTVVTLDLTHTTKEERGQTFQVQLLE